MPLRVKKKMLMVDLLRVFEANVVRTPRALELQVIIWEARMRRAFRHAFTFPKTVFILMDMVVYFRPTRVIRLS